MNFTEWRKVDEIYMHVGGKGSEKKDYWYQKYADRQFYIVLYLLLWYNAVKLCAVSVCMAELPRK